MSEQETTQDKEAEEVEEIDPEVLAEQRSLMLLAAGGALLAAGQLCLDLAKQGDEDPKTLIRAFDMAGLGCDSLGFLVHGEEEEDSDGDAVEE